MINSFKNLGKSVLQKYGYYATDDENIKREIFVKNQAVIPRSRKKDNESEFALAINFDTQKKEFEFRFDKEVTPANRDYFLAFDLGGSPRGRKKFISTNNLGCFFDKFIDDALKDLEVNRSNSKSREYFNKYISKDYDALLTNIRDTFYVKQDNSYVLNRDMLKKGQRESLLAIEEKLLKNKMDKPQSLPIKDLYNLLINKEFYGKESKKDDNFPPIALATINGEHILEHQNRSLRSSYINMVYFDRLERHFSSNNQDTQICHACAQKKAIMSEEMPLQMKFYGTTNPLFFENLKKQGAYKSFAICKKCLTEVLTGMRYTCTQLCDQILGISCYLVPSMENIEERFEKKYKRIFKLLQANKNFQQDIEEIHRLITNSAKKDFCFDLLFFDSPQGSQEFNIIKLISDVEYKNLSSKLLLFRDMNELYKLPLLNNTISINDLRYHLFPNKFSHEKPDPRLYRKDILDLLEAFIHGYSLSYRDLIKRFMNIYRLKFHRKNIDSLAAFKMILILSIFNQAIFNQIKPLKGVSTMGEHAREMATDIQNNDYLKFFTTHQAIYENSPHRQGLFLLGTIINKILYAQRDKSSNFMKKINLSGIHPRRVNRLIAEARHFADIYDIYEEPGIWGNIMDRLQGIENSTLNPDEVVFYILTGSSFGEYIGRMKSMENKANNQED